MSVYDLLTRNKLVFKEYQHILKPFSVELKRMSIEDLFYITNKLIHSKTLKKITGGTTKRKLENTAILFSALPKLCSLSLQAILYNLRGVLTKGELCYMIKDIKIQDKIDLHDAIEEYQNALSLKKKQNQDISIVFPDNLTGYLVHTHGGIINDPDKTQMTIPKNTYIIHLTELGKLGISGSKDNKLFEILQNKKIIQDFLYLLTFDYKNDFLDSLSYLKNRIVYGPFSIMPNSIVSMSNIEKLDCFSYYKYLDVKTGEIQFIPIVSVDKLHTFAPYGQGIYELPIEELNKTEPVEVLIDFIDTKTKKVVSDNKTLSEMKAINSNYEYFIDDIPEYEKFTTSIIEHHTKDYLASSFAYNKSEAETFKKDFKTQYPEWNFKEDGKFYSCSAKMFDQKIPRKFETITDITKDDKKDEMLFSDLIKNLRERTNAKYGEDKKLIIITAQCRSFYGLEEDVISGCLRLENTSITLMNLVERTDLEEQNLKDAYDNFTSEFPLAELITSFTKSASMHNVRFSDRIQVKAKRGPRTKVISKP